MLSTFNVSGSEVLAGVLLRVTLYVTVTVLPRLYASTELGSAISRPVSLMGRVGVV